MRTSTSSLQSVRDLIRSPRKSLQFLPWKILRSKNSTKERKVVLVVMQLFKSSSMLWARISNQKKLKSNISKLNLARKRMRSRSLRRRRKECCWSSRSNSLKVLSVNKHQRALKKRVVNLVFLMKAQSSPLSTSKRLSRSSPQRWNITSRKVKMLKVQQWSRKPFMKLLTTTSRLGWSSSKIFTSGRSSEIEFREDSQ